jgi:hypothetical protein
LVVAFCFCVCVVRRRQGEVAGGYFSLWLGHESSLKKRKKEVTALGESLTRVMEGDCI